LTNEQRRLARADGQRELDEAFDRLEQELPNWLGRKLRWLRSPKSRWVRIPLAILLILQSAVFFLPFAGLHLLPVGLLLIAQDIPALKRPVARAMLWLLRKWVALRRRRNPQRADG
jgi:hypothetical protein